MTGSGLGTFRSGSKPRGVLPHRRNLIAQVLVEFDWCNFQQTVKLKLWLPLPEKLLVFREIVSLDHVNGIDMRYNPMLF
jgi:hypothetical protein